MTKPSGAVCARRIVIALLFYIFMSALAVVFLAPLVWMVGASLRSEAQVLTIPPTFLPTQIEWQNYVAEWEVMVPAVITPIPLYIIYRNIGWIDTHYPLIVPRILHSVFAIFLLCQFFRSIPLTVLPVLVVYFPAQRYFVKSITLTGIKG